MTRKAILKAAASLSLLAILGMEKANAVPEPHWFQGKVSECNEYLSTDIEFERSQGTTLNFSGGGGGMSGGLGVSIPGQLDKSKNPGAGKCCIFDDNGNIIPARFKEMTTYEGDKKHIHIGGSGYVTKGNDECQEWLEEEKSKNNKAHVAGLSWCVGETTNCHMDWWYITVD